MFGEKRSNDAIPKKEYDQPSAGQEKEHDQPTASKSQEKRSSKLHKCVVSN